MSEREKLLAQIARVEQLRDEMVHEYARSWAEQELRELRAELIEMDLEL